MLALKFFYLIISIFVLVKSADYFTESAEKIGLYLKLPPFIVGITIVSIGTSLPELVTSIFAVLGKESSIVAGNVAGSNIANIFLVLGVSAIISKGLLTEHDVMKVDLPMVAASAFFLYICSQDGVFDYKEGILSLIGLIIYMIYATKSRTLSFDNVKIEKLEAKTPIILVLSIIFVNLSAKYTIINVVEVSKMLNVPMGSIAASVVAVGTSLPELMVSLNAAKKGNIEMSIGNVIGSNIFNTFGIMGTASLVGAISIDKGTLSLSLPVMIAATILIVFSLQNKAMSKWIGYIFILFYILYIIELFS
jgi:cation:H+ antiporter